MKFILPAFAFSAVLFAAAPWQTFTGTITDTMCGAKHTMMKGHPGADCVTICLKGSSEYALYDGKDVWKLSDQKSPAKFADAKVTVIGTPDPRTKTIKVVSVTAVP